MSIIDLLADLKLCDFIKHMVCYKMSTGSDTVNLIQLSKKKKKGRKWEDHINNTVSLLTVLKVFIWKQKDNISSHMTR